ncbi:MAG: hypothetical protein PQJ59_07145 [Spirochaetales bacterium]|nr:hypothetical protein [Spirochaetales bacterium]
MRKKDYIIPLGKGALFYILALLLTWMFTDRLTLGAVTVLRLFRYTFQYYNGLTVLIWLTASFIFSFFEKETSSYRIREYLFMVAALFGGDSLYRVVISESWYGIYELFLLPLSNMALMVFLSLLMVRMDGKTILVKMLLYIFSLAVLFVLNIVPTLYLYNKVLLSLLLGILLFVSSLVLYREELKGGLPGSVIIFKRTGEE